jgi:hypothetical protein
MLLDQRYNYIKNHDLAISIDRLDNKNGHDYENFVLCLRRENLARSQMEAGSYQDSVTLVREHFRNQTDEEYREVIGRQKQRKIKNNLEKYIKCPTSSKK